MKILTLCAIQLRSYTSRYKVCAINGHLYTLLRFHSNLGHSYCFESTTFCTCTDDQSTWYCSGHADMLGYTCVYGWGIHIFIADVSLVLLQSQCERTWWVANVGLGAILSGDSVHHTNPFFSGTGSYKTFQPCSMLIYQHLSSHVVWWYISIPHGWKVCKNLILCFAIESKSQNQKPT